MPASIRGSAKVEKPAEGGGSFVSFLMDTDVLSEAAKRVPDPNVKAWLANHQSDLFVSSITLGEIRYGIEKLPNGKRQNALKSWLATTTRIMDGRVLSFNGPVAHVWGQMRADLGKAGCVLPVLDGQIAAIAKRYELTIATRNQRHFKLAGIKSINPFLA